MQTRFWLASAATVALATTGALVAGTISLHGQAPQATAPQRSGPPPASDALPDHEFTIPRQLVADAAVVAVEHTTLPEQRLEVTAELLLLEDA